MTAPHAPTSGDNSASLDAAAALNALDDAYVAVAADWRIAFANAAFHRLPGVRGGECVGRDLWQTLPAVTRGPVAVLLRATMEDGKRRSGRLAFPDDIGGLYDVKVTAVPAGGICVQFHDLSESTRPEEALAERSEENASLRQVARALAEEVDLAALLRVICREAMVQCDAAGAAVGQIGDDVVTVVAGTGAGEAACGFRFARRGSLTERAVAARAPIRSNDCRAEYTQLAAAFQGLEIGPALVAPLMAHDQMLGILMVVRSPGAPPFADREERRIQAIADHAALALWKTRLFEQVQEANRTKSEFMATISHELRTPLTALTGYEELLADEVFGPLTEQQQGAIERMRTSTDLLTVIIEEILTFSRLEAGEEPVHPRETTVQEIVYKAAAVLEPLALEKQLDLEVITPDSPVPILTDADMVRRILVNLGANAIKFTERGSVAIEATLGRGDVIFAVRDTGIGIAASDLPRLFQPFVQLDTGFTRRYGGTGLGLYISQRLAGLLGGRIEVESELGNGSVFRARIPREWNEVGSHES